MCREIVFMIFMSQACLGGGFFDLSKEGWHYYQEPPKESEEREEEEFIASIPLDNLSSLGVKKFQETFERVRGIAVMKPTQENITAYRAMMKFSLDQSKLFAINNKLLSLLDDTHDYHDIGNGGFSNNALKDARRARDLAKHLNENIVFVTFVNGDEELLSQKQIMANLDLKREFGVDTRTFSIKDYPEMVKKLNITEPVENFIFYKEQGRWQRIRRGLIDANSFISDYLFFEEHKENLIKKEEK